MVKPVEDLKKIKIFIIILIFPKIFFAWNYMFFSGELNNWINNVQMDKQWGYQHWHIIYVPNSTDLTNKFKFIGSDDGSFNWAYDYGDDDTVVENTGDTADYQPAGDGDLEASVEAGYAYIFSFDTQDPHDKRYEVTKITNMSLCGNYYVNWDATNSFNLMTKDASTKYVWRKIIPLTNGKIFYFKFVPNKSWSDPISTTNAWAFCDEDGITSEHYTNINYPIKMNDATNIKFSPAQTSSYQFYINLNLKQWKIIKITTADTNAPNNITNFNAKLGNNSDITLKWKNPTNSDYSGVMIRYKTTTYPANTNDGILVANLSKPITNFIHTELTNGKTYYYKAFAYDTSMNYATGATNSAGPVIDTKPPNTVTSFNLSPANQQISISWNNPSDSDLKGVLIKRKSGSYPLNRNDGVTVFSNLGTSTIDSGLTNGITYYYKIWAYDEVPNFSLPVSNFATPQIPPATKTIDGNLSDWSNYERMETDGTSKFYLSWNNTNLYFAFTSFDHSLHDMFLYIDTDPEGPNGLTTSVNWDGTYNLPVKFDYAVCIENNTYYDLRKVISGNWQIIKRTNEFCQAYIGWSGKQTNEFKINWTNFGSPSKIRILCFSKSDSTLNVVYSFPIANPTASVSSFSHYYNLPDLSLTRKPHTEASLVFPVNLSATAGDRKVTLTWNDNYYETDHLGFNIYKTTNTNMSFSKITPSPLNNTSYTDKNVQPLIKYYYKIRGVLTGNYESSDSPIVSAIPYDATPPEPVTDFDATNGPGKSIALNWTNPTNSDFAGTKILRKTTGYPVNPTDGTLIYNGISTSFTDTNVSFGWTYYYSAFSYDIYSNYSALSDSSRDSFTLIDITPPNNVTNFKATAGTNSDVFLSWKNPTNSDYNGVIIRRKISSYPLNKDDGSLVINASKTTTNYYDTGLLPGTNYYYRAFAYDNYNNYATNLASATDKAIPLDKVPPHNITNFTCVTGDNKIILYWQNPTDPDWTGTIIRRKINSFPSNPTNDGLLIYNGTGISFVDTNVINGTNYFYTAFAYDRSFNYSKAVPSAQDNCIPRDKFPPNEVSNFQILPFQDSIILNWINPTNSDFQFVMIRYSTISKPLNTNDGVLLTIKSNSPGSSDSFTNKNLTNQKTYYFTIFTADEVPNFSSGISKSYLFADFISPSKISDLVAWTGLNNGEVILRWTAVGDNLTNGQASKYILKYSTLKIVDVVSNSEKEISFDQANNYYQNWIPKKAGEIEEYTLKNLPEGKKLYFRIKAVDKNNNEGELSNLAETIVKTKELSKIENVITAPNPCPVEEGKLYIYFKTDGFINSVKIKIYTITGILIYENNSPLLNSVKGWNKVEWDLKDNNGEFVPNGTYILIVEKESKKEKSKFTILRSPKNFIRPYYNPKDENYGEQR